MNVKLETIKLDNKSVKIKSENSKEDSNYYTLLIGENGVGKTKIFEDLIKEKSYFEKVVFSAYTLFNRTSKHTSNKSTNVYISNFNSKSIISQVSNLYVENMWLYHNDLFEDTLNEIYRILEIGSQVRVDLSSITRIGYTELFNKIHLDYQKKRLLELLNKREKISCFTIENLLEVYEENRPGFKDSQINQMLTIHFIDNEKVQKLSPTEERIYEMILIIKSILIDAGYKKRGDGIKSTYFFHHEIEKLYHDYFNLSKESVTDLLKIDFQIFRILELDFANNLLFTDDTENPETKQLDNLSSGEFAMITRFMELAGEVKESSLILIDEPETFLNPKWINEFIYLLKILFKNMNCHFILASQSPFIINNLHKEDIIKLKKVDNKVVCKYEEEETFGADFNTIVKEIFHIDLSDNKLVSSYLNAVEKKSKESILEAFRMIPALADSAIKVELMRKIASEDNLDIIKKEIEKIERNYFYE